MLLFTHPSVNPSIHPCCTIHFQPCSPAQLVLAGRYQSDHESLFLTHSLTHSHSHTDCPTQRRRKERKNATENAQRTIRIRQRCSARVVCKKHRTKNKKVLSDLPPSTFHRLPLHLRPRPRSRCWCFAPGVLPAVQFAENMSLSLSLSLCLRVLSLVLVLVLIPGLCLSRLRRVVSGVGRIPRLLRRVRAVQPGGGLQLRWQRRWRRGRRGRLVPRRVAGCVRAGCVVPCWRSGCCCCSDRRSRGRSRGGLRARVVGCVRAGCGLPGGDRRGSGVV